jgi:hypothetical protein
MIDRQEARSDVARIDPAADRWLHTANREEHLLMDKVVI